ncbi:MAG: hypothetical protein WC829_05775 [Hyphomicrobium sp.]|jgi:hypothetical protein
MQQVTETVSGTTTGTTPIPLDYLIAPFQVSVGVGSVVGTVSYTLQYTYDDVFAPGYNPATGNWFNSATMVTKAAAFDTALVAPVRAIRFTNVGSGSFVAEIIQAGR